MHLSKWVLYIPPTYDSGPSDHTGGLGQQQSFLMSISHLSDTTNGRNIDFLIGDSDSESQW